MASCDALQSFYNDEERIGHCEDFAEEGGNKEMESCIVREQFVSRDAALDDARAALHALH